MELPKLSDNLLKRIISAGILIPLTVTILALGGMIFKLTIIIITVLISFEWANLIANKKTDKKLWQNIGIAYIAVFATATIYLRELDGGFGTILYVLISVWAIDIAAYFAGKIIGGPKLLPKISPNKTWAGLAGGTIASCVVSIIFWIFILKNTYSFSTILIIGILMAPIAQAGDFFESYIKRKCDAKDSGNIIPGHGGLLDRIDGLMVVMVVFAILAILNGGRLI